MEGKPLYADAHVNGHANPTFLLKQQDSDHLVKIMTQTIVPFCSHVCDSKSKQLNFVMVAFIHRGNPLLVRARLAQLAPDTLLCVRHRSLLLYLRTPRSRESRHLSLQLLLRDSTLLRVTLHLLLNLLISQSRDGTRLLHHLQDLRLYLRQ